MAQNVLVLVLDTARADAFEPYGAAPGCTPAIAQIASGGAAAEHMYSTACWTLPSHASMFTGALPRALGLGQAPATTPQSARPVLEAERDRMLPEVLRRAGWETRGVSANIWVSPGAGFATGFDEFVDVKPHEARRHMVRSGRRAHAAWALEGLRARADDGASQAEATVGRWLDTLSGSPFFWFVNLVECHSPYLPPRPYNDLGPLDRLRAAEEAREYLSLHRIWQSCLSDFAVPEQALERMRHLYARSVRLMDDWIARVLEAMDRRGVLEDTLVIVTSDHGENFGEGGLLAHAFSLDERLTRVPFVVSDPGFLTGHGVRSLADMPAMLAGHLGLEDHPWTERPIPDGYAVAQFDFIEEDDARVQVMTDLWGLDDAGRAVATTPLTSVTDGRLKLLRRGDREELYDLVADPLEARPMDPAGHSSAAAVRALRELAGSPAAQQAPAADLADEHALVAAPTGEGDDADDLEGRMKLLGYM